MLDKDFYHGDQGVCFKKLEKHHTQITHEFNSHKNKRFLEPEDFSDSVRGAPEDFDNKSGDYVHGEWQALPICIDNKNMQSNNDYPMLYDILKHFPYKINVAIMQVGPNTQIGNHTDNEGGWRYQMCLDDGGGDESGMYVMNLKTKQQDLHTWRTGHAYIFQPGLQLHNGFNKNKNHRTTLLIDFWKELEYTEDTFDSYYQNYSECFEGLENLVDLYESRKQKT